MKPYLIPMACALSACHIPTYDEVKSHAENEARAFASESHIDAVGVSCSSRDSDMDGDVGCTLSLADGTTKPIECNVLSWGLDEALYGQPIGCKLVVYAQIGLPQGPHDN